MEKINFCSAMQPKSLKEFPEERCEFCADYYRAADVDALLSDVRRLVEAAKNIDSGNLVDDVFYRALDSIYQRGWHDHFHNRPYDARGNKEWQFAFDLMRKIKEAIAAVERHL